MKYEQKRISFSFQWETRHSFAHFMCTKWIYRIALATFICFRMEFIKCICWQLLLMCFCSVLSRTQYWFANNSMWNSWCRRKRYPNIWSMNPLFYRTKMYDYYYWKFMEPVTVPKKKPEFFFSTKSFFHFCGKY